MKLLPLSLLAACLAAAPSLPAQAPAADDPLVPKNTVVTADRLDMKNTGVETQLVLIGNVHLEGTNLTLTCDRAEIYAEQIPDIRDPQKKAAIGKIGALTRVLATGHVTIQQVPRTATAGRAEVLPQEGKIILTEEPVVTDIETKLTVSGTRMTFFRDERAGQIENPKIVGPALPNLGAPREAKPAGEEPALEAPAGTPPATPPAAAPAPKAPAKSPTPKPKP